MDIDTVSRFCEGNLSARALEARLQESLNGRPVTWMEKVSDEQYLQ